MTRTMAAILAAPKAGPRALLRRQVDALHCSEHDRVLGKALGLIAGGASLVLALVHRMTSQRIGD